MLPFNQTNMKTIEKSECWVFTMGDALLNSYSGPDISNVTHEAFELKVKKMKFEYASSYEVWRDEQD